jgi:hypothetical protein
LLLAAINKATLTLFLATKDPAKQTSSNFVLGQLYDGRQTWLQRRNELK